MDGVALLSIFVLAHVVAARSVVLLIGPEPH